MNSERVEQGDTRDYNKLEPDLMRRVIDFNKDLKDIMLGLTFRWVYTRYISLPSVSILLQGSIRATKNALCMHARMHDRLGTYQYTTTCQICFRTFRCALDL